MSLAWKSLDTEKTEKKKNHGKKADCDRLKKWP